MGYYSNQILEPGRFEDRTYPSPGMQLRWRLEELLSVSAARHADGITESAEIPCVGRLTCDEILHAPAGSLAGASEIACAIAFVRKTLVSLGEEDTASEERDPAGDGKNREEIPGQISIWEDCHVGSRLPERETWKRIA